MTHPERNIVHADQAARLFQPYKLRKYPPDFSESEQKSLFVPGSLRSGVALALQITVRDIRSLEFLRRVYAPGPRYDNHIIIFFIESARLPPILFRAGKGRRTTLGNFTEGKVRCTFSGLKMFPA